ncbi:cell wall hydrolase [Devosia sp.]|jgi:spore germination cell wall hydrolase CwlJ-like protein|uniref:cell wall hydrolase n=1 Tax=Devosia TaxID=46913 RepID=UPI0022AFD893|nr:cell wall hydrolase [Devosia neptuniae]MCZ4346392.1 cell wall hydrolase [Devosia neptuniae]|tara:strand:- start:57777 stop:58241 length:465 start_codon:yes stop_codon:yes gene_type:complete
MGKLRATALRAIALVVVGTGLGGCSLFGIGFGTAQLSAKECMMRAMYFESNRSSPEGMLAVGTVVMNRVDDTRYPKSICGVVGQKNQFAQGVLTRKMTDSGAVLASQMADQVINGARHAGVRSAQHFHTAGLRFPYNNMHYVLEAGGNEFYEKY